MSSLVRSFPHPSRPDERTKQTPRPIGFLSTVNSKGERNLAPFSYFNMVSHDPPCVMAAFTHP